MLDIHRGDGMEFFKRIKTEGISLRFVHRFLLVIAILASGLLLYATYHTSGTYARLSDATDEYIELQKAAYELMDASDYLTESVQRFTVEGNMRFLNNYFSEVFENHRREHAITVMSKNANSAAALDDLQKALNESNELMKREYYAMKLVIDAKGYQDYPDVLKEVELSKEDAALTEREKMDLAQLMVMDDTYYGQKDLIREDMKLSLNEIEKLTHDEQK